MNRVWLPCRRSRCMSGLDGEMIYGCLQLQARQVEWTNNHISCSIVVQIQQCGPGLGLCLKTAAGVFDQHNRFAFARWLQCIGVYLPQVSASTPPQPLPPLQGTACLSSAGDAARDYKSGQRATSRWLNSAVLNRLSVLHVTSSQPPGEARCRDAPHDKTHTKTID